MKAITLIINILSLFFCMTFMSCKSDEPVLPQAGVFNQVAPKSSEKGVLLAPTFTWEPSENAETYMLVISMKTDFSDPINDVQDLKATSYNQNPELAANTRYYWKVTAVNKSGMIIATNAGISFRTLAIPASPSPGIYAYYVATTGEDNPGMGTKANPFKTLAYAATMVPAAENDTIFLGAGTFEETEPALIPIGVNVKGAGESKTILSSTGVSLAPNINPNDNGFKLWYDGSLIQLISPHRTSFRNNSSAAIAPAGGNQTISGFTIDGNNKSLKAGVWVENRNDVTMHHVTFKNLGQRGAVFASGNKDFYVYPDFYMSNIKIYDCTFINSGKDLADETLGNLNIAQLDGAEIYNITINDNEGYGIKFIYDGYFKNVKIHDCIITLNESDAKWGEDIAIELWNNGPGNEIYNVRCNTWLSIVNHPEIFVAQPTTKNMKVYNIRMIDKDGTSGKEAIEIGAPNVEVYDSYFENKGIGIAVWDMGRENITIRNNIFFNSAVKDNWAGGPAIYIDNSRNWDFKNIKIYNNIFDTFKYGIRIKGDRILDIDIKNNVFMGTTLSDVESTAQNVSFGNNLKYNGASTDWALTGVSSKVNNLLLNPGFLLTGEKWDTYYKAASAQSSVVDNGVSVGITYNGNAPDMGRWEY